VVAARIRKGDLVEVITGKDRGRRGAVLAVDAGAGRVTVERVNVVKKHQKPTATNRGGIIEREAATHLSNVMLVHRGSRTRVGFRSEGESKVRFARKQGEAIDG
jgi:large subunit ribosomal protein L24